MLKVYMCRSATARNTGDRNSAGGRAPRLHGGVCGGVGRGGARRFGAGDRRSLNGEWRGGGQSRTRREIATGTGSVSAVAADGRGAGRGSSTTRRRTMRRGEIYGRVTCCADYGAGLAGCPDGTPAIRARRRRVDIQRRTGRTERVLGLADTVYGKPS